jgi:hypothetical protein
VYQIIDRKVEAGCNNKGSLQVFNSNMALSHTKGDLFSLLQLRIDRKTPFSGFDVGLKVTRMMELIPPKPQPLGSLEHPHGSLGQGVME